MKQVSAAKFPSDCEKIVLMCDADTPLGVLHDFLMRMKGEIVDRMIKAQKEEEAQAKEQDVIDAIEDEPQEIVDDASSS